MLTRQAAFRKRLRKVKPGTYPFKPEHATSKYPRSGSITISPNPKPKPKKLVYGGSLGEQERESAMYRAASRPREGPGRPGYGPSRRPQSGKGMGVSGAGGVAKPGWATTEQPIPGGGSKISSHKDKEGSTAHHSRGGAPPDWHGHQGSPEFAESQTSHGHGGGKKSHYHGPAQTHVGRSERWSNVADNPQAGGHRNVVAATMKAAVTKAVRLVDKHMTPGSPHEHAFDNPKKRHSPLDTDPQGKFRRSPYWQSPSGKERGKEIEESWRGMRKHKDKRGSTAHHGRGGGGRRPPLGVPEKHQLRIARQNAELNPAMQGVMGGPNIEESKKIIQELTGRPYKQPKVSPWTGKPYKEDV